MKSSGIQGFFLLSLFSVSSLAATSKAWNQDFIKPCECDASFDQAFPKIFGNRIEAAKEAKFLDITSDLIKNFTASEDIENSKKYIYWTVYELGAFDIVNALIDAKKSGVNVVVITDGKSVVEKPKDVRGDQESTVPHRNLLTREAFKTLKAAKIPVAYSDPEFEPISTSYPPIMHEKIRMFAVKKGKEIVPTFAYVSTHNDTYSETVGDPLTSVPLERLKKGKLTAKELDARSKGNVQTSFIVRNKQLLNVLFENTLDQYTIYKNGKGRIYDLPNKEPVDVELRDGTTVNLSFTYGRRPSAKNNPNIKLKDFVGELLEEPANTVAADFHLQQFVFSYSGASDNLKKFFEKNSENVSMNVWIDGNFAFEPYSQARKMAGMYTVLTYREDMPIEYPWKKTTRQNVDARAYVNNFDKLHTKNSFITYQKQSMSEPRYRIFTGSLNLSSNGVSNKELFLVIDTPSPKFVNFMKTQAEFLKTEGYLKPIDDSGLFLRIKSTARKIAGATFKDDKTAYEAYSDFLKVIEKKGELAVYDTFVMSPYINLSKVNAPSKWVDSLAEFLENVGAEKAVEPVTEDLHKNLKETGKFYPSVSSVDILLHITEQSETIKPAVKQSILDLFSH